MVKKTLWLFAACLMVFSLVLASCSSQDTTTIETDDTDSEVKITETTTGGTDTGTQTTTGTGTTAATSDDEPRYGGTLTLTAAADVQYFDPMDIVMGGITLDLTNQRLWDGDWSKGPAGGYGSNDTLWSTSEDVRANKMGYIAEKTELVVDNENNTGKIIYTIREGVNFAVNPDSAASRLVAGRDITADDVLFTLKRVTSEPQANIYRANPVLRTATFEKTGPNEITVTVPKANLLEAVKRFNDSTFPVPQEVIETFGDMRDWKNSVGTGPFMLVDYVVGSAATLERNPAYWMTDPVGPGKGNQLPYLDTVKWLIIPDLSTRMAAFRTGKIDQLMDVVYEDSKQLDKNAPGSVKAKLANLHVRPIHMRTDIAPFSDKNVRRAMMMATDFETIERDLYDNQGQILTWPYEYTLAYKDLYLGLDDPDCPESVKELYVYNPEKAKQLLRDAGYPNGFAAKLTLISTEADYYSIIKEMWAQVGIDLQLDIQEAGVHLSINMGRTHEHLITSATGPPSIWPMFSVLTGSAWQNSSMINDPVVNRMAAEIGAMAITDEKGAMQLTREMLKHVLDQAWVIPSPSYPSYNYWWPWVKNYSGERSIGYFWVNSWPQYVWIDEALKASMTK